jgi:transcriptional regulator with XRE-family HTH domain
MDLKPSSLGVAAGVSKSTIQKWIDASYTPHFSPAADKLKLVADYCGVTVDWLLDQGPFQARPAYEPSRAVLNAVRSRLLRRNYPSDAVNDVLLTTDFTNARDDNDVFDLAEGELAGRGLSANFWSSVAAPTPSVTFAEGAQSRQAYARNRSPYPVTEDQRHASFAEQPRPPIEDVVPATRSRGGSKKRRSDKL